MLIGLSVRNIVLIDRLDLSFEGGLSVLTGETGAGKSILLDALTLALGGRGDQGLVRRGHDNGQVSAIFHLGPESAAFKILRDNDFLEEAPSEEILAGGTELILRRVQYGDGRTRAFINDTPVSAQLLKKVGQALVEIHGQHDERALVDVHMHRALLDAFGGNGTHVDRVSKCYGKLMHLQEEVDRQEKMIAKAQRDEEFAAFAVEELSQLSANVGEEHELAERRRALMALEKAADEIVDADKILGGPSAPVATLTALLRRLQRKDEAEIAVFLPLIEGLDASLIALDQTEEALETIKRDMDFDPNELNATEERLFALRAMARKHHVTCDELGAVLAKYEADLVALKTGSDDLVALRVKHEEALTAYQKSAGRLSDVRAKAGSALEVALATELPDLKLGAARFIVELKRDEEKILASGFDSVSFNVQTNPGTVAGPILKVASGGELSRFLLALKVVLADRGSAPVLIFDEIDTGVGGAVADAMGRRLERLAKDVQVLTVTHAPQVAARASTHMLIEKQLNETGQSMRTHVRLLDTAQKGEEIARMLAGAEISDEARAAAKRLISEVG